MRQFTSDKGAIKQSGLICLFSRENQETANKIEADTNRVKILNAAVQEEWITGKNEGREL